MGIFPASEMRGRVSEAHASAQAGMASSEESSWARIGASDTTRSPSACGCFPAIKMNPQHAGPNRIVPGVKGGFPSGRGYPF